MARSRPQPIFFDLCFVHRPFDQRFAHDTAAISPRLSLYFYLSLSLTHTHKHTHTHTHTLYLSRTLEDIPQDALVQEYIGEVHTAAPLTRGFIDFTTSMVTDEEPLRGLLFY